MTRSRRDAQWRGAAVGVLTAALAVAAHGTANAAAPSGGAATLLVVLAATLGGVAASCRRADGLAGLTVLLGGGQVLGHLLMATAGHVHAAPGPAMVAAHAAAAFVGAALIVSGERLGRALSQTLRGFALPSTGRPRCSAASWRGSDQPLQWMLLLAASVSHRGPPVGFSR